MEQSLSKDIRKLYTKSIMWTVIMSLFTIIVCIVLIALLQRYMMPADHAENKAIDAIKEMRNNTQKYLDEKTFSQKQKTLQENNVYLSEYLMNGRMVSGPEKFRTLFQNETVLDSLNSTITDMGYYHQVVPINEDNEIGGVWVYSYELKATFSNEYYRYIMIGVLFIILLSPMIYFIIFSRYYINKLYQSIKHPIDELMAASHKIGQKDLDFNLNYNSENEIGKLTNSFRKMQNELKKSLYENWRKDSEWALMMSSLSHDLKTPATLIALSSEVLDEEDDLNANQQSQIDIIIRNITKVNNILKSMGQANHTKDPRLIDEVISIDKLIKQIESDITPLLEKKIIQYKHELKVNKDIKVPNLKMNRILQNLFQNAIQYTPENGIVYVFVKEKGYQIHFAIEDSGPGVERENRDLIFSKYHREDLSRLSSLGNAGLGLFITKKLVRELGGEIQCVDPKVLSGLRIEITIPYEHFNYTKFI